MYISQTSQNMLSHNFANLCKTIFVVFVMIVTDVRKFIRKHYMTVLTLVALKQQVQDVILKTINT